MAASSIFFIVIVDSKARLAHRRQPPRQVVFSGFIVVSAPWVPY